jgi:cytochrome d ubiquinol oxidase subunit II
MMPALTLAAIILAGVWNARQRPGMAFTASSLSIALVLGTAIAALFPSMVPAWNAAYNLTIYNSSSSLITLRAMLILALIGLPIVMGYSIWVYWTFRGKVKIGESHY